MGDDESIFHMEDPSHTDDTNSAGSSGESEHHSARLTSGTKLIVPASQKITIILDNRKNESNSTSGISEPPFCHKKETNVEGLTLNNCIMRNIQYIHISINVVKEQELNNKKGL